MNAPAKPNDYSAYPDASGRFGDYGGRYVPETLMPLVLELDRAYAEAKAGPNFQAELANDLAAPGRRHHPPGRECGESSLDDPLVISRRGGAHRR